MKNCCKKQYYLERIVVQWLPFHLNNNATYMEVYSMKKMRLFVAILIMIIGCATGLQAMKVDTNGAGEEVKKLDVKKPFKTECTKIKQENLDFIDGLLCGSFEDVQRALRAKA